MEIGFGFIAAAFTAGLLTFLAPCTLPLVPGYLAFISGVDERALRDPARAGAARRAVFRNGALFILGFTIVFVAFGTLAGLLGAALAPWRLWLARAGGVLVILFGLFMVGALKIPFLSVERRLRLPSWLRVGTPAGSLAVGGAFAAGWTPCVGPVLGSILLFAGTAGTAATGALLLLVFSAGLALPFLAVALGFSRAAAAIARRAAALAALSAFGGILLIVLGVLLASGNFGLLIETGYRLFEFVNYDRLLDFL